MLSLTLIYTLPGYSTPSFPSRISSSKPHDSWSWIHLCFVVAQIYQQKGKLNHSAPWNRVLQAARHSVTYTGITQYQYTQYGTLHQINSSTVMDIIPIPTPPQRSTIIPTHSTMFVPIPTKVMLS